MARPSVILCRRAASRYILENSMYEDAKQAKLGLEAQNHAQVASLPDEVFGGVAALDATVWNTGQIVGGRAVIDHLDSSNGPFFTTL